MKALMAILIGINLTFAVTMTGPFWPLNLIAAVALLFSLFA